MFRRCKMDPTFDYFMGQAMALESDIIKQKREMLLLFLHGESAISLHKEFGYSYERCREFLIETAKETLGKRNLARIRNRILLYVPDIRHFKEELLEKLSKKEYI